MYDPNLQKMREHEKKLKKRKGKLPAKSEKVSSVIGSLFYTNWGSDFAKFLKMIVKNADEQKVKNRKKYSMIEICDHLGGRNIVG